MAKATKRRSVFPKPHLRSKIFLIASSLIVLTFSFQNCGTGFQAIDPASLGLSSASEPGAAVAPAKLTLTAARESVFSGSKTNITWSSSDVISCTLSSSIPGETASDTVIGTATSGTQSTGVLTSSTTYTLTCVNADGSTSKTSKSITVEPALLTQVAVGSDIKCVLVGDAVRCWGRNQVGSVGNGSRVDQATPLTIISEGVSQISAGWEHVCALMTDTSVQCWGANGWGQIGNGQAPPEAQQSFSPSPFDQLSPVTVIEKGASYVFADLDATCAIVNGMVYCWGAGLSADNRPKAFASKGATSAVPSGGIVAVIDGGLFQSLRYGPPSPIIAKDVVAFVNNWNFNQCAIVKDALQCWGAPNFGLVGNGKNTVDTTTPTTVIPSGVTQVTIDEYTACAIVNGSLSCWGDNSAGSVGNGSTVIQYTPVSVIAGGVTHVSGEAGQFCAVVKSELFCWGGYSGLPPTPTKVAF